MTERTFRSLDEIKKFYTPKAHEKERLKKMSPKEFGKHLAQEILDKIKKALEE